MKGAKDLVASERGIFCVALMLISMVFVLVGKLSAKEWINYSQVIAGVLVVSKTATGIWGSDGNGAVASNPAIPVAKTVKDPQS